ncbi:MAG: YceD family protein, partial [Actinomycetota bacterium]
AEGLLEGVVVSGRVSGTMHLACTRCLKEYEEDFEQPVDEVFYYEQGEEKGGYDVCHDTIDLEPVIRDAVVLGIPEQPLHDPHCKGLCPDCGADLNLIECGHGQHRIDSGWAGLIEIAQHLEERS